MWNHHPFYSKILVTGLEAEKCLQGQLTCDLQTLDAQTPKLGAHCNHQGRIVSVFFILREAEGFALFVPTELVETAKAHLQKYTQFFRTIRLGVEPTDFLPPLLEKAASDIVLAHIDAGLPLIFSQTSGVFLPHDINLPNLGGVSFTKGCYTGQEIVARMENWGKPKQHLYHLTFAESQDIEVFAPGEKLFLPDKPENSIGHIVQAARKENAIVALASVKEAALQGKSACDVQIGSCVLECYFGSVTPVCP